MKYGMNTKWGAPCQVVAEDALTKQSRGTFLSHVQWASVLHLINRPDIKWAYEEERAPNKQKRKLCGAKVTENLSLKQRTDFGEDTRVVRRRGRGG